MFGLPPRANKPLNGSPFDPLDPLRAPIDDADPTPIGRGCATFMPIGCGWPVPAAASRPNESTDEDVDGCRVA